MASNYSEDEEEFIDEVTKEKFTCIICKQTIKQCIELPCNHIFCQTCLFEWGNRLYRYILVESIEYTFFFTNG